MSHRWNALILSSLGAIAAAAVCSITIAAQSKQPAVPDLSGTWTNGTTTPFERPIALGNKAFYTEEEAVEQAKQAAARRAAARTPRPGEVGNDNEAFVDSGYAPVATRQTSLVIDPPDGRVSILPAAEKQREQNVASADSYERMSPWDRCITLGPAQLFPGGYNNAYQIVQTRDYVVIVSEMIHEARIVPLDGRPKLPPPIKQWTGESRGHWEGATLVVETTNFHDRGWLTTKAMAGRLRTPVSDALRMIERFTRTDANTISYQITVEDPKVYAKPWTLSMPLVRNDSYAIYEYACQEGNQAVGLILRGARTLERETSQSGTKP